MFFCNIGPVVFAPGTQICAKNNFPIDRKRGKPNDWTATSRWTQDLTVSGRSSGQSEVGGPIIAVSPHRGKQWHYIKLFEGW
jgi:hypothetical protein